MKNNKYSFIVTYWGEANSTEVRFQISRTVPKNNQNVTSVMGAVFSDGNLLLTKPKRGWGLPGGHIEANESPEECLKRECIEEAEVEIDNLRLIGYWKTKKIKKLESNKQYPDEGYQLLYLASATKINEFIPNHEVTERIFVSPEEVINLHHNYERFKEILNYINNLTESASGE